MLFGWGRRSKSWDLGNGYSLLCVYKYFHFYYIIRFITEKKWYLQGDRRSDDRYVTADQVRELLGGQLPQVSPYSASGPSSQTLTPALSGAPNVKSVPSTIVADKDPDNEGNDPQSVMDRVNAEWS